MADVSSGRMVADILAAQPPQEPSTLQKIANYLVTDSIPAQAVKSAYSGLTSVGDAWDVKIAPDEMLPRAMDAAGMLTLGAGAIPAEANTLRQGISAYHGSPHSFDRFSLDKIGTGEGNKSYGHGLYFAENEGVAKEYRDALSNGQGHIYEVGINADPNLMLDWDRPLSEQPDIMASLAKSRSKTVRDLLASDPYQNLAEPRQLYGSELDPLAGSDLMRQLSYNMTGKPNDIKASQALQKAGIPGVKFLDAGSRDAGTGSLNYVVFDDNLVNIVRKYGIAGALGAGLISATQAAQMQGDPNMKFLDSVVQGNAT